jgi:paraquat-inducible protein B
VKLSEDLSHALILARINHDAEDVLVEDTRFWVVKPRISREGISGFGTVLSGAYIQLYPGDSEQQRRQFDVLEQPPVALDGTEGIRIKLVSQLGNSLRPGDPVTYQGYTVGRVETVEFDSASLQVNHQLYIEKPYDALINSNTRFWSAKGVNLELSSTGFEVNIASLESLISGGVTFSVLEDLPASPVDPDRIFQLFPSEEAARQGMFSDSLEYVLLVEDTVRGLSEGAPVEFRGIRVGTVKEVPWRFTSPQRRIRENFAIPVLISLEPQRLGGQEEVDLEAWRERLEGIVRNGLRATLKSGNLLTGALFVDLNFEREEAVEYKAETFEGRLVIPTTPTGLAQIELKVSSLLDKLNSLKVEPILAGMDDSMQQSETLLREVRALTASIKQMLNNPEIQQVPANINQTLAELRDAIKGLSPESQAYQELNQTLQSLETLLRDLQPLARTLGEQPNALIFNPPASDDPQPPAAKP